MYGGNLMQLDINNFFKGANVVITGGAGTIGSEIARQLLDYPVKSIRIIDNDEHRLFEAEQANRDEERLDFYFGDIRDEDEMCRLFSGMDYCFHTAALKHVPFCERSPFSAVQTNIEGTNSIIKAALDNQLTKVLFTSSDKAVNPTNVMGTSKLMGERLFTASNFMSRGSHQVIFASTRFGNVVGSSGSVVPLFCQQIEKGGPVTLTDQRMTRFMMTTYEAVKLVIESIVIAEGGEVFVTKMPTLKISDVAEVLADMLAPAFKHNRSDIEITETGARPGEKIWEELSSEEESRRVFACEEFLVVQPSLSSKATNECIRYGNEDWEKSSVIYNSDLETPLDKAAVKKFLMQPGVLTDRLRNMLND